MECWTSELKSVRIKRLQECVCECVREKSRSALLKWRSHHCQTCVCVGVCWVVWCMEVCCVVAGVCVCVCVFACTVMVCTVCVTRSRSPERRARLTCSVTSYHHHYVSPVCVRNFPFVSRNLTHL